MGRKPMTAEQREKMRSRILDAARYKFLAEGIEGLSMRGIANRVGVSSMTLYLYYESRDDIVRHIVLEGFQLLNERLSKAILLGGTDEKLEKFCRAYLGFAQDQSGYYAAMFSYSDPYANESEGNDLAAAAQQPVGMLVHVLCGGGVSEDLAKKAATNLWATLHGWSALCIGGHIATDAVDLSQFLRALPF